MKVTQLEEQRIQSIGHAFGYYDYGDEKGLVCVTEPYQGQGYMHLGMELVGTRNLPGYGKIYELAKYPDK